MRSGDPARSPTKKGSQNGRTQYRRSLDVRHHGQAGFHSLPIQPGTKTEKNEDEDGQEERTVLCCNFFFSVAISTGLSSDCRTLYQCTASIRNLSLHVSNTGYSAHVAIRAVPFKRYAVRIPTLPGVWKLTRLFPATVMSALYTSTWGNPNATKHVLLIHGITASSQMWYRVAQEFASRGKFHIKWLRSTP